MSCSVTEKMVLIPEHTCLETSFMLGRSSPGCVTVGHFQEVAEKLLCINLNTHIIDRL